MPDLADDAAQLEAEHLARSLAAARATIPAGAPGECDNCGDAFPRLVGGLCGFCRDGRRPLRLDRAPDHDSHHDDPAPAPPAPPPSSRAVENLVMSNPPGKVNLTITIDAALHERIAAEARRRDVRLSQVTRELVEAALAAPAAATDPTGPHDGSPGSIAAWLEHVPNPFLTDEIARRMGAGIGEEEYGAAIARAEAAEARIAQVAAALGSTAA